MWVRKDCRPSATMEVGADDGEEMRLGDGFSGRDDLGLKPLVLMQSCEGGPGRSALPA